ncbi:lysozyme inhibitor LprI family protein [Maricaulis parjimensis]|uniref:lysozyme inhibitor LprI family protein n=1 Tax=Maricaulis parjimensis TaxID=144023 RepID=UPI0019395E7E|nr:lysozyme inhibitor LprI family protein [Maricaulis parjimensis]
MLLQLAAGFLLAGAQPQFELPRPAVECAEHLTNWPARRSCLRRLLSDAEDQLETAEAGAREEAREIDLDTAGQFHAVDQLDAAQSAWLTYRDSECDRRVALMFISEDSREEIGLDCRISLTRARAGELRDM